MRRNGDTTRIVDEAIQKLFKYGEITIPLNMGNTKYFNGKNKDSIIIDPDADISIEVQRQLFSRLRIRLDIEHHNQFIVNPRDMTITLKEGFFHG